MAAEHQEQLAASIKDACSALLTAQSILIVSHYNPDADAYGSSLGLMHAMRALGKKVLVLNESGVIERYAFLAGLSDISSKWPQEQFDLLVVCDCGDIARVGESLLANVKATKPLLNIDHHRSNDSFGSLNVVDSKASSTAELIYKILVTLPESKERALTKSAAICLYAGLSADTGSFRYSSTTEQTFAIAQALVKFGAEPHTVSKELYGRTRLSAVKLQAQALSCIETYCRDQIAVVTVDQNLMKKFNASPDDTEELCERARDIEGVSIALFLRQDGDFWKGSLRSKIPELDLSKVAACYGGGGHKSAAGFRSRLGLVELKARILEELTKLLA